MAITVTVADIRTTFPEFSNTTVYPDEFVQTQIDTGLDDINMFTSVAAAKLTILAKYLIAHYIVIAKRAANGDYFGLNPIASKTLGDGSMSYQSSGGDSQLEEFFSATVYGELFWDKLKMWRLVNKPYVLIGG